MKDFGFVCIWICSVFILQKEYLWIGCDGPAPKFWSRSFRDILIAAWGGPLLYTEGIFWCSRSPCDILYSVLFRVAQYAIHQSCQAIQYTWGSRSYGYQFPIICILHLHTLLIECQTHVYSCIPDEIVDIWVREGALTF